MAVNPLDPALEDDCLIEARQLCVSFRERTVLDHIDMQVHRGEIVTLIGLNGAGKSTLVRALLGLITPESGSVVRRPGLRIGYSPQQLHLDATLPLTVAGFLTLGARTPQARLRELLAEVGVEDVLESQIAGISGGELHRVLLARALLRKPDLLVLDDPREAGRRAAIGRSWVLDHATWDHRAAEILERIAAAAAPRSRVAAQ